MSDEQTNTEPELTWEQQQQAEKDAETRRQVQIQLDETEKHLEKKKTQDLGSMTDEQLRRYTRRIAGYDAI
jgi:hypothetical protein